MHHHPPPPLPLRIAMISEHASPLAAAGGIDSGGQNIYVAHVAKCLVRLGHEVDVFTRRDDAALAPVVTLQPGLRVVHVAAGPARRIEKERLLEHMPAFLRSVEQFLRGQPAYDLAHAHFFMSGWVARQLQRSRGLPFAITFHALGRVRLQHQKDADRFPAERIAIEHDLVRHADALIAECPQDRSDLLQHYHADAERIAVVPCGFDPEEFAPLPRAPARAGLGLDATDFVVLQLGRLVPRKGIDNVIEALAELPRALPARLLIVGGEPGELDAAGSAEVVRLRGIAERCGVAERVRFEGQQPRAKLARYYSAADVFVSTPWYEPFGITPLEAMACATPVVGSAVGGIQYSVEHERSGFLVPPRDPRALAARLLELQRDPVRARAMGEAGRQRAQTLFTWERVARELLRVYGLLARRRLEAGAASAAAQPQRADLPRAPLAAGHGGRSRLQPAPLLQQAATVGAGAVLRRTGSS